MSIVNGLVIDPEGWYEIASILGCVQDAGACCTSDHINWRSKRKPIQYNAIDGVPDSLWKSYKYGLNIPVVNIPTQLINGTNLIWDYPKPNGSPYPYRVPDFNKYYHNAPNFLPQIIDTEVLFMNTSTVSARNKITIPCLVPMGSGEEGNTENLPYITVHDLQIGPEGRTLNQMYLGVILKRGSNYYYVTNDTPGVVRDWNVIVPGAALTDGETIEAVPFASYDKLEANANMISTTCCGLNQGTWAKLTMKVKADPYKIDCYGFLQASTLTSASGTVRFTATQATTFKNVIVYLKSAYSTGMADQIGSYSLGDISVGANETVERFVKIVQTNTSVTYPQMAVTAWAQVNGQNVWSQPSYVMIADIDMPVGPTD